MNPHHNSNQNPATPSAAQQVNSVTNQQTCNGNVGGLLPNNRPIAPPSCFMNFPNQPFPLQNTMAQFPTGFPGFNPQQNFNPFPVNQFNPSQFFPNNSMNRPVYNPNVALPNEQVIMQNTIQNIYQLLQLQSQSQSQNPNYPQCPPGNFPMFQNQIPNVMSHQNPGFLPNQQFSMPNFNGPLQHANQVQHLQGNPFLPHAPNSVQPQQSPNLLLQNQIPQGVVPQNHNFLPNQMNPSGPMQIANQGQKGQQGTSILPQKPSPTVTNFQEKHGNNINGGWTSPHKNFTGNKKNDTSQSHKGFKSQFHHGKHPYNGNMNQAEGKNNAAVNSRPKNFISTKFEKKVPSLKYTEQEIKQWREARKKHYPTNVNKSKEEEASVLRRQQLKEILTKQAELGCEVADIPSHYLSGPEKHIQKHEKERFKKGKFQKKRGNKFQNDRITKKTRSENPNKPNENKRDPSLLQKLLTKDIKRDQNHLLQVFRFMVVNSFFSGQPEKPLRFPDVIVRETGPGVAGEVAGEPDSLVVEGGEKVVEKVDVDSDEEEGEITD